MATAADMAEGSSTSSDASTTSTVAATSSSSKCLSSKFSSPFKRKPKGVRKSKEDTFERLLLADDEASSASREELLRLFILKLDEEANYFQVSASPEEELCDCQKCQVNLLFPASTTAYM